MRKDKKETVSVIINAKNEQDFIGGCLESVGWADEVILLIAPSSTDKTREISEGFKVKIVEQEGERMDYAAWHNQGIRVALGDWLLWIDADERVTPLLRNEIQNTIINTPYAVYAISRRNFLLGKELHWGGWYPDYAKRLFRKQNLEKWVGELHEQPVFSGELGHLKEPMIHLQPEKIEPALQKSIKWSIIEADLLYESGHPSIVWWRVLRMGVRTLFERLIKKQGFRDGVEGWIESVYQAYHTMIVYLRLWEMQNDPSTSSGQENEK